MAVRNLAALSPLAPAQLGMLIETLGAAEPGVHVEQLSWPLRGDLDPDLLEAAWAQVVRESDVLRTGFLLREDGDALQYVLQSTQAPLELVDLSGLSPIEQPAALDRFLDEQRAQGFALDRPPLLRLALLRCAPDLHHFVWTFHHIILDGWSVPLLAARAFSVYESMTGGGPRAAWSPRPYREFVAWLATQADGDAQAFWAGRLGTARVPTALGRPVAPNGGGAGHGVLDASLDAAQLDALELSRRAHQVTLSTILQGAWALLLAHYSGVDEVVFGATVSGRPPQFDGIETMAGLFINTIPVGMRVPASGDLWAWLGEEQLRRAEERRFEHCSTGQIHEWLELPGSTPLFESIVVFENYPMPQGGDAAGGLAVGIPSVRTNGTHTQFPLALVVTPGAGLDLRFVARRHRLADDDVAVVADGLRRLLARIAGRPGDDLEQLRTWIARLPVPGYQTVQRAPDAATAGDPRPASAEERELAALWQELLRSDAPPGLDENFFEIGGHSLLALRLTQEIRRRFACELALHHVFEAPTVRGLAGIVAAARSGDAPAPVELPALLTLLRPGSAQAPLFLAPPGAGTPVSYSSAAAAATSGNAIYGFQTPGLNAGEQPLQSVTALAEELVACMREVQPAGPYHLGGWSFGAMVAWEAARLLQSGGERVDALILLDAGVRDERAGQDPLRRAAASVSALAEIAIQVGPPRSWTQLSMLAQLVGVGLPDSPLQIGPTQLREGLRSFASWRSNVRASLQYEAGGFDGEVVLVRAAESWPGFPDPVQQRLSELTQGRVRVLPVPGNHMTMMLDPANATAVGDTLSRPKPPRPPRSASPRASSRRATPAAAATPVEKSPMTEDIVQILALDGTEAVGGTGYVAAALLGDLQSKMTPEQRGNFLNKATIFTGTSAGSANALFLAMAPDPDTALAYIHAFWKESEAVASQGVSPLGFVKTLIGLGAVLSTKKLRGFYLNYFGMLKLGDLPHKVVVPSFKLDDPTDLHGEWRPKVFHNMDANDPDMEELVVDVLMRSSSPPLLTPVYQSLKHAGPGYVDGGVWANNPSMAAIGQVVHDRGNGSTDGIRVLSVSNGTAPLRMTPKFKDGYADLGYVQWLLNPWFVGALVNLLVTSGQMAVEYQGGTFLLDRFQRLNPQLPGRMLQFSSAGIDECVAQILEYDNTIAQVTATLEWLEAIDWYGAP